MRWFRDALVLSVVGGCACLLALNWRAQLQTQQKLDALVSALAERPAPALPPAPASVPALAPAVGVVPSELSKVKLPPYVIEAPDVLVIEAALKDAKTGKIDRLPEQALSGQHLVRLDGTVGLGRWGSVTVAGLTIEQATAVIRKQLDKFPEVSADNLVVTVDVVAYNSKRYYVITDGGDSGEQVVSFPVTGSETVLDAVANVSGLPGVASKRSIHIARRTPNAGEPWQTLPVDWTAITRHGVTTTNYQIVPGDRIYVKQSTQ